MYLFWSLLFPRSKIYSRVCRTVCKICFYAKQFWGRTFLLKILTFKIYSRVCRTICRICFFTKQFSGGIFLLGVDVQEHKHEASSKKQLSSYYGSVVNMQLLLFIVEICQLQETITITYLPQWSFGKHATFYCWDSWLQRWRWLWWILKNVDDENEYMCEPYEECVPLKKQCVYCIPYDNDGACTPPDTAQRQSPGWGKLMHTLSFWGKERQLQTINLKWAKG